MVALADMASIYVRSDTHMKKVKIIALLICLMTGCLLGCSRKQSNSKMHSIEVTDIKKIISECPKSAKAGDTVTIKTNSFMDAIPKIDVNGNDIGEWDDNITEYTFIMPDEDVKIRATLNSSDMV